jgi:hypothetical protein
MMACLPTTISLFPFWPVSHAVAEKPTPNHGVEAYAHCKQTKPCLLQPSAGAATGSRPVNFLDVPCCWRSKKPGEMPGSDQLEYIVL